eukprot:188699-Rhodomonas_salina.1
MRFLVLDFGWARYAMSGTAIRVAATAHAPLLAYASAMGSPVLRGKSGTEVGHAGTRRNQKQENRIPGTN